MKTLFEKTKINQMELKNRFVRSGTTEGLANPDGSCTDKVTTMVEELALGQVGLIIAGHAYINPEGKLRFGQLGIHDDSLIDSYREMVKKVHEKGSKIILEIGHGGGMSRNGTYYGPSELDIPGYRCREITTDEINKALKDFKGAALRAEKAGFEGIQIQAGHGFLLSQFLSSFFNKRKDCYGGSLENRARLLLEIVQNIRAELSSRFVIAVKINADDFIEGGFRPEDMVQVSEWLENSGVDAIEISGGTTIGRYSGCRTGKDVSEVDEVYYREAAKLFKKKITIPLMLVGGIRSYEVARELVENDIADHISLCRPLIREPHLIKRWQSGDTRRATCTSCNKCFVPMHGGKGLYCVLDK